MARTEGPESLEDVDRMEKSQHGVSPKHAERILRDREGVLRLHGRPKPGPKDTAAMACRRLQTGQLLRETDSAAARQSKRSLRPEVLRLAACTGSYRARSIRDIASPQECTASAAGVVHS